MTGPHAHVFTALWTRFGPFGDPSVHYHVCFDGRCSTVLVGEGRDCDGRPESHREERLGG